MNLLFFQFKNAITHETCNSNIHSCSLHVVYYCFTFVQNINMPETDLQLHVQSENMHSHITEPIISKLELLLLCVICILNINLMFNKREL